MKEKMKNNHLDACLCICFCLFAFNFRADSAKSRGDDARAEGTPQMDSENVNTMERGEKSG